MKTGKEAKAMQYNFPPFKNLKGFAFGAQLTQVAEELEEVKEVFYNEKTKIDSLKLAEEVLDLLHAVETLVRLCEKRLPKWITIDEVKSYVLVKNALRGYYNDGLGENE